MGKASESRCTMSTTPSASRSGRRRSSMSVGWISEASLVWAASVGPIKARWESAVTFANAREGWPIWEEKLSQLDAPPSQILIGMEATSCYHENLYHELEQRGYVLRLLHPGQTHQFHERQGLRAKTDRLDAMTIAKVAGTTDRLTRPLRQPCRQ